MIGSRQIGCMFCVCVAWLSLFGGEVAARPAQVVLLRHGEKPADNADVHLTERGRNRAAALPEWFNRDPALTKFGPPVALYASRITRQNHGRRPFETLEPLSAHLNLPIEMPYSAAEYRALAERVLTTPQYEGKTVVICWSHEELPRLAAAFGLKKDPPDWKGSVYDRAWIIRWSKGKPKLIDIPQHLLPGDSKK